MTTLLTTKASRLTLPRAVVAPGPAPWRLVVVLLPARPALTALRRLGWASRIECRPQWGALPTPGIPAADTGGEACRAAGMARPGVPATEVGWQVKLWSGAWLAAGRAGAAPALVSVPALRREPWGRSGLVSRWQSWWRRGVRQRTCCKGQQGAASHVTATQPMSSSMGGQHDAHDALAPEPDSRCGGGADHNAFRVILAHTWAGTRERLRQQPQCPPPPGPAGRCPH